MLYSLTWLFNPAHPDTFTRDGGLVGQMIPSGPVVMREGQRAQGQPDILNATHVHVLDVLHVRSLKVWWGINNKRPAWWQQDDLQGTEGGVNQ